MPPNALVSIDDYETLIYGLPDTFSCIRASTLVVVRTGPVTAIVRGEVLFGQAIVLRVVEVVNTRQRQIEQYGYELWRGDVELWWYDSWPHPDEPELASTHPHHQHIPPDIKQHRIPAPELSFSSPNLPSIIRKIEQEHLSSP